MAFFSVRDKDRSQQSAPEVRPAEGHLNYMAGISYDILSPITRLRFAASTCFFGEPMYYQPADEKNTRATREADRKSVV